MASFPGALRASSAENLERLSEKQWNPDGKELFPGQSDVPVECRILWLLSCNWHAVEDLKIVLREIRAGEYPGDFIGHADHPDYLDVLDPVFDEARAWMLGNGAGSGEGGELLGEPTAENRWLVAAFATHVSAGQEQQGYGPLEALDDMIASP